LWAERWESKKIEARGALVVEENSLSSAFLQMLEKSDLYYGSTSGLDKNMCLSKI